MAGVGALLHKKASSISSDRKVKQHQQRYEVDQDQVSESNEAVNLESLKSDDFRLEDGVAGDQKEKVEDLVDD